MPVPSDCKLYNKIKNQVKLNLFVLSGFKEIKMIYKYE
jgi:hypothetical protein